ncbi:hypothetical protein [Rubripirellula reticaptiva]|nr:hypothetical protein [Rubripirellula reticaptiva]
MRWILFCFVAFVAILIDTVVVPVESCGAAEQSGLSDSLAYNRAIDLYRGGQLIDAAALFQSVAASSDSALAAKARYNLGNSYYRQAVQAIESQDPKAKSTAIDMLRSAIAHYRSGLRLDPADDDGRANIESAAKLIQQLEQPDPQESESQQSDETSSEQDSQNQGSENQGSENQDSEGEPSPGDETDQGPKEPQDLDSSDPAEESPEPSEQKENGEESQDSQPPEESEKQEGESADQSEGSPGGAEQDEPSSGEPSPGQNEGPGQDPGDPNETDGGSPSKQEEMPEQDQAGNEGQQDGKDQGEPDQGETEQGKTDDKSEASAGELTESDPSESSDDESESGDVAAVPAEQSGEMTPQEARKMLQAIRDRDMIRRLRQKAAARDQRVIVDRDW